jgi:heme/copper-type cytochrome/quinol oxidase subunit 2
VILQKLRNVISKPWWHWLLLSLLGWVVMFVPLNVGAASPTDRTIRIDARRFEYNPAVIKVNPGDRVTFELVAEDVVHGLSLDGYDLEVTADPGKTAHLAFVADKQGTFRFHCTTTCGNMHPFMIGKLEVGRNVTLFRGIALAGLIVAAVVWKGRK